jgi:hypothetical protein
MPQIVTLYTLDSVANAGFGVAIDNPKSIHPVSITGTRLSEQP